MDLTGGPWGRSMMEINGWRKGIRGGGQKKQGEGWERKEVGGKEKRKGGKFRSHSSFQKSVPYMVPVIGHNLRT